MFTEADDIALHMEQNRLEAEKKRKASQREAASTLESLTMQQQVQIKKLQEHVRYDQLREEEALKTPLPFTKTPFPLPGDLKFQDGGVFVSTFNPPPAKEEAPLHMAISRVHNPYLDLKPPAADKPQTNDIHHVHVPYKSPTVLSTVTTTPTFNSTETKDLKTHAVINNEVNHDVKTHPVFEAELPSLPNTPRSPTKIEVIDLTIDGSENSSAQPPKKKRKTTTINVMVIVTRTWTQPTSVNINAS
jgi:hypothetical protein